MSRDEQVAEFCRWLQTKPLGPLEDVRVFVEAVALDNAADCGVDRLVEVAQQTVLSMLDDESLGAELMSGYRR